MPARGSSCDRPLEVGLLSGRTVPARHGVLANRRGLAAEEVVFAPFAEDYERLCGSQLANDGDFGYIGSAYWGIPWLEAIMGCPVVVAAANCCAKPCLTSLDNVKGLALDLDTSAWLSTLLRFTQELVDFSAGRFPVCPPLLRGAGDTVAAMLGEMTYVTGFFDAPATMQELLDLLHKRGWG